MYEELMEEGKRKVVRKALQSVEEKGPKSPHQLLLTFRTQFPGVVLGDGLLASYPEEMSIILKNVFWNLVVQEDFFSVELLFDEKRKTIKVPFKALVNFMDPDAEFALQFNWEASLPKHEDNVIFLDHFRKLKGDSDSPIP